MPIQLETLCKWCDTTPVHGHDAAGRPRQYCSDVCRNNAYRERKRTLPGRNEKHCPDCYLVHAGECPF